MKENKEFEKYYELCPECFEEVAVSDDMVDWKTGIFTCPICGVREHLCSMCSNDDKCDLCSLEHSMFKCFED